MRGSVGNSGNPKRVIANQQHPLWALGAVTCTEFAIFVQIPQLPPSILLVTLPIDAVNHPFILGETRQ